MTNQTDLSHYISPNFTHAKLIAPRFDDLVDVFEDRMRNWYFSPTSKLLDASHGDIAAVSMLVNYFEGIEIYLTGRDSKNKSREFFANGFKKVFSLRGQSEQITTKIIAALYVNVRCGFAHDGMFRNRVFFGRIRSEPILITWPIKNGVFDESGEIESILINPVKFFDAIQTHFNGYVTGLREGADASMRQAFETAVALKWGMAEPEPVIGMTEEEFSKR